MKNPWRTENVECEQPEEKYVDAVYRIDEHWLTTATPEMIAFVDQGLVHLAEMTGRSCEARECSDAKSTKNGMHFLTLDNPNVHCTCGLRGRLIAVLRFLPGESIHILTAEKRRAIYARIKAHAKSLGMKYIEDAEGDLLLENSCHSVGSLPDCELEPFLQDFECYTSWPPVDEDLL